MKAIPKEKHSGEVIIVTGAAQGLGEGIARYLAEFGVEGLVICDINKEKGESVEESLTNIGVKCLFIQSDLTKEADCRKVVKTCDKNFGKVDGLVNAAGSTARSTLEETTVDFWDNMFALNVRAPFILIQECVGIMKREKIEGRIVNIVSKSSHGGQPYLMAYSVSKGALAVLTKNVAHSLRFDHIRVNGLNLGWMYTPNEDKVQKACGKPDSWLEVAEVNMPFKRILRPLDVAKITSFLLSKESEMMTGAIIEFDQEVMGCFD